MPEDPPAVIYPEWWADKGDGKPGSYSYQNKRLPEIIETDENGSVISTKSYLDGTLSYQDDIKKNRIPIREVFVNTSVIIKAVEDQTGG